MEKIVCPECGSVLVCRSTFTSVALHEIDEDGKVTAYIPESDPHNGFEGSSWECKGNSGHDLSSIQDVLDEIEGNMW